MWLECDKELKANPGRIGNIAWGRTWLERDEELKHNVIQSRPVFDSFFLFYSTVKNELDDRNLKNYELDDRNYTKYELDDGPFMENMC